MPEIVTIGRTLSAKASIFAARVSVLFVLLAVGCMARTATTAWPPVAMRGGVTFVRPHCVEARSCLLGQVIAAETATPMSAAAVFLEREGQDRSRIVTLTDDQGIFSIEDAPRGRYRLAVYKDARRIEARGLELGAPGTIMVPVRLAP